MNAFTSGFNYGEFAIVKPVEFDGIKNADVLTDTTMKRLK
jgi:hypothetical protein